MQAEDLKGWLAAEKRDGTERDKRVKDGGVREEDATPTEAEGHWGMVVELVQTAFRDGDLAEEATWQAVVLIPKGKGDYRSIGLGEVTRESPRAGTHCTARRTGGPWGEESDRVWRRTGRGGRRRRGRRWRRR